MPIVYAESETGGFGPFLVCVIVHMGFPLLPLGIELFLTQDVGVQSLSIVTTMYLFSIGASSRVKTLFFLMLAASIMFSAAYGYVLWHHPVGAGLDLVKDELIAARVKRYAFYVLATTFGVHLIERFRRHVVNNEPFPP